MARGGHPVLGGGAQQVSGHVFHLAGLVKQELEVGHGFRREKWSG